MPAEFVGILGLSSENAHFNDGVRVHAELSEPAFCYLIVLKVNGERLLCLPREDQAPPNKVRVIEYPDQHHLYYLNDAPDGGVQAFVLLASREPLPDYDHWLAGHIIPWKPIESRGV